LKNPLNKCANLTRQIDPPSRPSKMSCHGNTPNPHANMTRQIHEPKIPPSPPQDPRAGPTPPPPPPPPPAAPSAEQGEGVGSRPGPPMHLEQVLLLSLECLHILTGHDIYAFYIERINKYQMYCFRRRKSCKEGVRSWSPPGPVKGGVLHNLECCRRPAGLPY
jgi:hypothetical protein